MAGMITPTPVPTPARLLPPSGAPRAVARFAGTQRRHLRARAGRTLTVYDTTGQGLTYGLDSAKRVTSVVQSAPNITGTRTVTYELDKAGNKTRAIWPDSYYVTYQFDDINRMTTVTENGTFVLATYVWDPLSRRASLAYGNGTTQSYSYSKAGDLETHTHAITGNSNATGLSAAPPQRALQPASGSRATSSWADSARAKPGPKPARMEQLTQLQSCGGI